MSSSKKKDKVDLSKLSAMELLLIGESQSLGSQPEPCSSKSLKKSGSQRRSSGFVEGDNGVDEMSSDSDETEGDENDDESEERDTESEDWEEVNDQHVEAELQRYDKAGQNGSEESGQASQIPEGGLEIVIPKEGVFRKKKHELTMEDYVRRAINRQKLELQSDLHKASLICQLARCVQFNKLTMSEKIQDIVKRRLQGVKNISAKKLDLSKLEKIIKWFRFHGVINKPSLSENLELLRKNLNPEEFLAYQITESTAADGDAMVLIFTAFLRALKIDTRLVISLQPISLKPPPGELIRKPPSLESDNEEGKNENSAKHKKKLKPKSKSTKEKVEKKKKGAKKNTQNGKSSYQSKNTGRSMISSSDEDYDDQPDPKVKKSPKPKPVTVPVGQDMWNEVYLIEEERWVSVDVLTGKVICDKQLEMEATKPLTYVLGWDENNKVKDVTRRYASEWLIGTQKLRVEPKWWEKTLKPFRAKKTTRDKEEDEFLDQHLLSLPIPKSVSEIKGHPLFVLRRHLLKYEGLYPENPPSLGFIKEEPVYSRNNVYTLHTRELWMREAKVVRIGEKPYKIVKARPKYDKLSGARLPEAPSELFGPWQTEDYIPPIAVDGKVPRNEWGNVELFTEKLLPQGCVHLRLPGLQRIAKKLDIDCAPAVVGFDFGCGGSRPAFDGFVVCDEFEETLTDAWQEEQEEKKRKDEEKRLQRIYGNWRKLVRGVLIRAKLEEKYSVNLSGSKRKTQDEDKPAPSNSKKSRKR